MDSYQPTYASSSKPQKILSCAECRRSKLKCDRQFPCESCRKRGLEHLCPHSALVTRPNLASDAEYLRMENTRLQARVRELEGLLSGLLQGGQQYNQPMPIRNPPHYNIPYQPYPNQGYGQGH